MQLRQTKHIYKIKKVLKKPGPVVLPQQANNVKNFFDEDLKMVDAPYTDALVITLHVGNFEVS